MPFKILSRLSVLLGVIGVLGASLSGCGGGGGSTTTRGNTYVNSFTGRAACQAKSHTAGRARWTVLVFLNAANNLQYYSFTNIAQMAKVGSDGTNLNIVVQWKQSACSECSTGSSLAGPAFNETRRYYIRPHSSADIAKIQAGDVSPLASDQLAMTSPFYNTTTKQTDMGDWRVLQDFVTWGAANYPADNLAVVVWDHGAGWLTVPVNLRSAKLAQRMQKRAVSIDSATKNEIETTQLATALTGTAQSIDALIFDASLMQMTEVNYEVRNLVPVVIGSEESPPGEGYPYDLWMADLKASINDPCTLGASVMNRFVNYFSTNFPSYSDVTQSAIDQAKLPAVVSALDAFGSSLLTNRFGQQTVIMNARENAHSYYYSENKDLFDYAEKIRTTTTAADLKQAATNLETALNNAVLASGYGKSEQNSYGLAIYVPQPGQYDSNYGSLALSQTGAAPNWAQFLQQQVQ